MNIYRKTGFFGFLFILCSYMAFGADFGVVVDLTPEYNSSLDKPFTLNGSVSPWVSTLFNPTLSLYASAEVSKEYRQEQDPIFRQGFPFLVELGRTELNWRPFPMLFLQFGRQQFNDTAGLVVSGLFDGVHGAWSLGNVRLSLGAFYTGLLYKKTADIDLSSNDSSINNTETDYGDMTTYFATRRVLVPITVEFPDLTDNSSLAMNGIAQFDVNDTDSSEAKHSQYLVVQYSISPLDTVHLTMAVSGGIVEIKPPGSAVDTQTGFAAMAGADWELPTELQDLLSLQVFWSNGNVNNSSIKAYLPITNVSVGEIFTTRLSGMMHINASYIARPLKTLSAEGGAGYFIRTDFGTFEDSKMELKPQSNSPPVSERFLGGELYASLIWAPQSALQITARGGVFLPGLGGAFVSSAKPRVKASLGTIVSF